MGNLEIKIGEYLDATDALAQEWDISPGTIAQIQSETIGRWIDENARKVNLRNLEVYELLDEIESLETAIQAERKHYKKLVATDTPFWFRCLSVDRGQAMTRRLQKLKARLSFMKLPVEKRGEIKPEHIERAKEYDWNKLLEFRHGKARCPFHEDRTPSFSVKNGRGKCFGCGWNGSTIDFVMEKEKSSFIEAVKWLCQIAPSADAERISGVAQQMEASEKVKFIHKISP